MTFESRNEARLRARLSALREELEVCKSKLIAALIEDDIAEVERAIAMYDALRASQQGRSSMSTYYFFDVRDTSMDHSEYVEHEVFATSFDEALRHLHDGCKHAQYDAKFKGFRVYNR